MENHVMSRYLVYVSPAVGHVLPLVPGLLELTARGHEVHVRTLPALVDTLVDAGLDASPVADDVVSVRVTDYEATTDSDRLAAGQVDLMERGRYDGPDLAAAIRELRPDALLVDVNAYGARTVAEASGLPFATLLPSVIPNLGRGIPPYGLGLKPMRGPLGLVRDRVLRSVVVRAFGKAMLPGLNALRADAGLEPFDSPLRPFEPPYRIIALTSEPLEYPRVDLPPTVRLVGTQPWDTPAERPAYLDEPGDPWVLVTCSTEYQGDELLPRTVVQALRDEPVRVLLTLADAYDEAGLETGGNVYVERFVPHGPALSVASAVVCHGGMGIVTKAACAGVPMVVVPFGRDQPEVARRVVESGAGVQLKPKHLTADRMRAAVRTALTMSAGAERVARQLDPDGAPHRFADAAENLLNDALAHEHVTG
jgi:UDP:flavonoid glycosyltransferase YjiC (YdhE family)